MRVNYFVVSASVYHNIFKMIALTTVIDDRNESIDYGITIINKREWYEHREKSKLFLHLNEKN